MKKAYKKKQKKYTGPGKREKYAEQRQWPRMSVCHGAEPHRPQSRGPSATPLRFAGTVDSKVLERARVTQ